MSSPHNSSSTMDEEDSSRSSFSGSPSMNSAYTANAGSFDLNYLLSLANPDFSSSSSESQSQPSRAQSPNDWVPVSGVSEQNWKWEDAMLGNSIDPNALLLNGDYASEPSIYPPSMHSFQFEQAPPPREPVIPSPLQYTIPEIIEPPQQPMYRPQQQIPQQYQPLNLRQAHYISLPQSQLAMPSLPQVNNGAVMDADAIGRRARELAGVEYAITPAQHAESLRQQQQQQQQQQPLVLPQLPQTFALQQQHSQSLSPPPSSSSSSSPPAYENKPRVKTSHTTIERRYRTNLNARIVTLRHAVPALRILEKDKFPNEKADERGYVDGVKAARKASKGSILGKAAEYIG